MKRQEFLDELAIALEGKLAIEDLNEIMTDYADVFQNGQLEGKSEEQIASEIGSPARVARTILEGEEAQHGKSVRNPGRSGSGVWECGEQVARTYEAAENGGVGAAAGRGDATEKRGYSEFQEKVNQGCSTLWERISKPNPRVECGELASMPRRFSAWLIDLLVGSILILMIFFILILPVTGLFFYENRAVVNGFDYNGGMRHHWYGEYYDNDYDDMDDWDDLFEDRYCWNRMNTRHGLLGSVLAAGVFIVWIGAAQLLTTLILWAFNGYTLGKWMLGIRVRRLDGKRIGFCDALLRELLVKGVMNGILWNLLNLGSFIWGNLTPDHKTVQDLIARTKVVRTRLEAPQTAEGPAFAVVDGGSGTGEL